VRSLILRRILILTRVAGHDLGSDRDTNAGRTRHGTSGEERHREAAWAGVPRSLRGERAPSKRHDGGLLECQSRTTVIQCLCELQHGVLPFARDRGLTLSQYEAIAHWYRKDTVP
jgi:hypothetical protein